MSKLYINYVTMKRQNKFRITKKVAKHGDQAILVIPRLLQEKLKPGTIVEVTLSILEGAEDDSNI